MHVVLCCPCGANLKADIKYVGREMKCPKCSTKLIVPRPPVAKQSEPELIELDVLDEDLSAGQAFPAGVDFPPETTSAWSAAPLATPPQNIASPPAASKKKKPKGGMPSKHSWIIMGSIVGVAILGFVSFLIYTYSQQRSQLARDTQYVIQSGQKVRVDSMRGTAQPITPPPPPEENPFDSGKPELSDASIKSSEHDLEMADLIELVEPSIVRLKVISDEGDSVGSGFFIDREGKIVTNYHVIQGASTVTVSTADGKQTEALGFLIASPQIDLAIIQIDPKALKITPIAIASGAPRRGEPVAAFGAPQGFSFSATKGIISGLRSGQEVSDVLMEMSTIDVYDMLGYTTDTTWIQTSAAISGGNSGGPLVNMKGEMIGVNTWTHPGGQNLNFASTAEAVAKTFRARTSKLHALKRMPPIRIQNQGF